MRLSVNGLIAHIILFAIEYILFPFFIIGCFNTISSYSNVLSDTRSFVDSVVDSREVTDEMKAKFYYGLSSNSIVYTADIYREIQTINPDPINPGQTIPTYTVSEKIDTFNRGDYITVTVRPVSQGPFEVIVAIWLHLPLDSIKVYKTARIR